MREFRFSLCATSSKQNIRDFNHNLAMTGQYSLICLTKNQCCWMFVPYGDFLKWGIPKSPWLFNTKNVIHDLDDLQVPP